MTNIKKFIDRVSTSESRQSRDVVLTLEEARFLRDEIAKLLADLQSPHSVSEPEITVNLVGSKW